MGQERRIQRAALLLNFHPAKALPLTSQVCHSQATSSLFRACANTREKHVPVHHAGNPDQPRRHSATTRGATTPGHQLLATTTDQPTRSLGVRGRRLTTA